MNLVYLLMLSLINSCIELEISAPSFPDIMDYFRVSESEVGLTITYNLVGFSLASLAYGPLSETYGRRKIMIIGNAILSFGAAACAFATSIEFLLFARFIQGIGAATSAVVFSAIIADVYTKDKAAKLYGMMNTFFSGVMALSPVLGGFINNAIGWRGNYGFVALICISSWILLYFFLPETKLVKEDLKIRKILADYKKLLSSCTFIGAASMPSLSYGCYMAFVAIAPFIYMQVFDLDILVYTFHQAIIVFSFSLVSYFSHDITKLLGIKKTIYLSLLCYILGSFLMIMAWSPYSLTIFNCIFCIGAAILYPIVFAESVEIFPEIKGTASSMIMGLRYFICSSITWAASYFYDDTVASLSIVIFITTCLIVLIVLYLLRKIEFDSV
jgi:DHA1 family bicyclomycin/chloramphenicol resistance-like MFS transporter